MSKRIDFKEGECLTIERNGVSEDLYVCQVDDGNNRITFHRDIGTDRNPAPRGGQMWSYTSHSPHAIALVQFVGAIWAILEVRSQTLKEEWAITIGDLRSEKSGWTYL